MRRPRSRPTPVDAIVRRIVGEQEGTPSGRRAGKTLKVFEAFARIGPPVSERAEPVSFKNGVLTLEVEQSVYLTELALLEPQIREHLNLALRKAWVKRVRLRVGVPRKRPSKPPLRPLTEGERDHIASWVAKIRDPDVRAAVRRAAERSVRRGLSRTGPPPGRAGPCLTPEDPAPEAPALTYGYGWRRPENRGDTA